MTVRRRPRQVGDVVRAELARLLREELRDPAIGFATITEVEMSDDLRSAKVHVSVFGGEEQFKETVKALNHARGHLRGLVGRNCGLRYAPDLHFHEDHTIEKGARIDELLKSIPRPEPELDREEEE
ncbi:MAG TPA: 30S ribosome-binding factor RbfA [Thermoanaerobaculia bacterium]|nr:30S ribosome-binding factor RbfA [Thermoanaerobaculia bacterium]